MCYVDNFKGKMLVENVTRKEKKRVIQEIKERREYDKRRRLGE